MDIQGIFAFTRAFSASAQSRCEWRAARDHSCPRPRRAEGSTEPASPFEAKNKNHCQRRVPVGHVVWFWSHLDHLFNLFLNSTGLDDLLSRVEPICGAATILPVDRALIWTGRS
jgi:hypothetical protein